MARPRKIELQLGTTGLKHTGGIVHEEFLNELQGSRGRKAFEEMSKNDPVVGAVVLVIKNLIRQADWMVEAASESPRDQEAAQLVREALDDMHRPFGQILNEIMDMVIYGWSFFEVVYKRRRGGVGGRVGDSKFNDNRLGWRGFMVRSQDSLDRWEFDDNGNVTALIQRPPPDYNEIRIPMERGLLFRTSSSKNNPEGESILRKAYRPWFFKKRIEEVEGIGMERDLNGLPVAWVPPALLDANAGTEDKATLREIEDMVKNVRNDKQAGLILPLAHDESGNKLFDFELLSARGRRAFDTNAIIMRYNRTIAMSALADFIILGHDNVGSFALASSKTKVFSVAVGAYMDEISDVISDFAIPRLLELNGMSDAGMPRLIHGDVETMDLNQLALYVQTLSNIGVDLEGEKIIDHLRRQAGLPKDDVSNELTPPEDSINESRPRQRDEQDAGVT